MGAQESSQSNRSNVLEVGEEYSKSSGAYKIWSHINPCTKNKKIQGTIFTKNLNSSPDFRKFIENGVTYLKRLKHPGVVQYLESTDEPERIVVFTERVQILDLCVDSLSFVEIHSGLRRILEVLVFLHEKAGISHNNISPSSIYVCSNGEWKLGSFEFAQPLESAKSLLNSPFYKAARTNEFVANESDLQSPYSSRDAYAFGKLISYVIRYVEGDESDGAEDIIAGLHSVSASLLNSEISLPSLLNEFALSNSLSEVSEFLHSVHLKTEEEKEAFYSSIIERLGKLPQRVVARRLCRLMLSRYVLLEERSHKYLYPTLLMPRVPDSEDEHLGLLPLELYRVHLIPEIVRVFCVRETAVRLGLLSHLHLYAQYVPLSQLDGIVLDEILVSAHDTDDRLVASSLAAMAQLVPLLGAEKVCPWKFYKSFVDGTPKPASASRPSSATTSPSTARSQFALPKPPPRPCMQSEDGRQLSRSARRVTFDEPVVNGNLTDEGDADDESWNDEAEWTNDWQDDDKDAPQKIVETPASIAVTAQKEAIHAHRPTTSTSNTNKRVAEYEIPPLKSLEDDFFADMAPEIKTKGTIIDQLIKFKEEEERKAASSLSQKSSSTKFIMDDAAEIGAAVERWGDDVWDAEAEVLSHKIPGSVTSGEMKDNTIVDEKSTVHSASEETGWAD